MQCHELVYIYVINRGIMKNQTNLFIQFALFSLMMLSTFHRSNASHITGGSLTYTHLGNANYRIRLELLRDCAGLNMAPFLVSDSIQIHIRNGCSNATPSGKWLHRVTIDTLSLRCLNLNPFTTCNGGQNPGELLYRWEDTVQLPTTAQANGCNNEWYFSWGMNANTGFCCTVTNQSVSGFANYFIDAYLNNNKIGGNNSVIYTRANIPVYCTATPIRMRFHATNSDGDSLHHALTPHQTAWQTPANYTIGRSAQSPFIGVTVAPLMDSSTGILSLSTVNAQRAWVNIKTSEFHEGVLVGYTIRNNIVTILPGACANMDTVTFAGCDSVVVPTGQVFYNNVMYLDTIFGLESCDTVRVYRVIVTQSVPGSRIAGAKHVFPGSTHIYRAEQFGNVSVFNWQVSGGTYLIHSSDEIQVDWGIAGVGSITVNCIDGNGCERTLTDSVLINNSVSVAENAGEFTRIYPQPATNLLHIRSISVMERIELLDLRGRQIQAFEAAENAASINLSPYSNGHYLLRLRYRDGSWSTHRFLLQR